MHQQPPTFVHTNVAHKRTSEAGGKYLNNYRKVRNLAEGSYGKVKLYAVGEEKLYAIKVISKAKLAKYTKFGICKEVSVLGGGCLPRHKNVVRLVEVIDDPNCSKLYVVMEYGGEPLSSSSFYSSSASTYRLLDVLKQALQGLRHLHANRVSHGDLKVEHLLCCEGVVKIADFGSSEVFAEEDDLLVRSPGTPAYTAPECCTGEPYSARKADVWALGVTFYVLKYSKFPFQSKSADDMYEEIQNKEIHFHPPSSKDEDGDEDLLLLMIRRMLHRDPSARPSAEQLVRQIEISSSSVHEIEENFAQSLHPTTM
jgi:[calcium/calmodulin-dependent protein kinase] kinase